MSEPRTTTPADLTARFYDLAERYETLAALDTPTPSPAGRTRPGTRVPPGAQQILDDDETTRTITAIDDWALFLAHVLADELDVAAPNPTTPARLRTAATHAHHFVADPDLPDTDSHGLLALAVQDDLADHLRAVSRITGRAVRRIRTGHRCHTGCGGQYVSPLGEGGDRSEDSLRCEKCGHAVPYSVWSRWPRARVRYVTVEHAARIAGTTVAAVKMRASRQRWRRIGTGADVRYHVDDVRGVGA